MPIGIVMNYYWMNDLSKAIQLSISGNFLGILLYYMYDLFWIKYLESFLFVTIPRRFRRFCLAALALTKNIVKCKVK